MKIYKKIHEESKFFGLFQNKNLRKTLFVTIILSILVIVIIWSIQTYGQSKAGNGCSYLDPPLIDFLAFIAALFLVIEGFFRIFEHPSAVIKRQVTRIVRILLGFSITTIHILQIMHK